jgi:hypothetical protein
MVDDEAASDQAPVQSSLAFMPADVLAGAMQLRDLRPNIEVSITGRRVV